MAKTIKELETKLDETVERLEKDIRAVENKRTDENMEVKGLGESIEIVENKVGELETKINGLFTRDGDEVVCVGCVDKADAGVVKEGFEQVNGIFDAMNDRIGAVEGGLDKIEKDKEQTAQAIAESMRKAGTGNVQTLPTAPVKGNCINCTYCAPRPNTTQGECRRRSPFVVPGSVAAQWGVVDLKNGWCGEFTPK